MQRAASTPTLGVSPAEDSLTYAYAPNSNRLVNVTDMGVATSSGKKAHYFNDRNSGGTDDYAYDATGNLVRDLNRQITLISYNVIGLPEQIQFSNNTRIYYIYTASGAKLQKQGAFLPDATPASVRQSTIDYTAAGVFTDQTLTFIPTAEGRALPPDAALGGTKFRYEYQLTDHLDNLRTACRCGEKLDSAGNVVAMLPTDDLRNLVQENHYDPWGLNLPDLEREAALPDWWQFSMKERDYRAYSEFEFRHYDATIGRFMSIDPLFQQFSSNSPFNYAGNNPSTFIDVYGLFMDKPKPMRVIQSTNGGWGGLNLNLTGIFNAFSNFISSPAGSTASRLYTNEINQSFKPVDASSIKSNVQSSSNLEDSPNVKAALAKKPMGPQARLAAAGWQSGQPIPPIDGIVPDYTIESLVIGGFALGRPVAWGTNYIAGSLKAHWLGYLASKAAGKGVVIYSNVLKSASSAYKGSTVLGHALSKHAGRNPNIWGKLTGNPSTWHNQALKHFDDIMNAPGGFNKITTQQGINFLEKRLPDGRGIRLNMDKTFKGFID